jgi:hypothetical protein
MKNRNSLIEYRCVLSVTKDYITRAKDDVLEEEKKDEEGIQM